MRAPSAPLPTPEELAAFMREWLGRHPAPPPPPPGPAPAWLRPHLECLALDWPYVHAALSRAYRRAARQHHPDMGGTAPSFRSVRTAYEAIRGEALDPGNYRKKFLRLIEDGLIEVARGKRATASKPASVYRFARQP